MTPEQWERMSWHQRQRFLHSLTVREQSLELREENIKDIRRSRTQKRPHIDPKHTQKQAKLLRAQIPKESKEIIQERRRVLDEL